MRVDVGDPVGVATGRVHLDFCFPPAAYCPLVVVDVVVSNIYVHDVYVAGVVVDSHLSMSSGRVHLGREVGIHGPGRHLLGGLGLEL